VRVREVRVGFSAGWREFVKKRQGQVTKSAQAESRGGGFLVSRFARASE